MLVCDYLILKRTRLDVPALFTMDGRYRYWGGFNLVAVAWTALPVSTVAREACAPMPWAIRSV